jgi:cell division transport system permease protein
MRSLRYAIEEALISFRRAGQSAAMSIGTITIAFLALGGFLVASSNLQSIVSRWASAAEMSIYLQDEVDEAAGKTLAAEIGGRRGVAGVEVVTKEQALARFKTDFPELGDMVAASTNPFPASIEVRLQADPVSAGVADGMATELAKHPGVADVRYDGQWLTRVGAIVTGVRVAGIIAAVVLILGAAFTVASVVRLSLAARHEEIDIMQLVGAPAAFIRGPFVAEGTLLGGLGAALAVVVLWAGFSFLRPRITESMAGLATAADARFLEVPEALLLVVTGCLVGGLAGVVASRAAR